MRAGGQGDTSPSTSPCPAEPGQDPLAAEQPVPLEDARILPTALPRVFPSSNGAEKY